MSLKCNARWSITNELFVYCGSAHRIRALERVVVDYDVKGKNAHDARLVAAMLRQDVSHLLTFNDQDFAALSRDRGDRSR